MARKGEREGVKEDVKEDMGGCLSAQRVPSGTRLSHRRKAKPCSAGSGSIGRVDTGAGPSSQDEAQSLDVEIALGDRILSYSVPTDWEPCQCGEQSIAFLVDEVPDNELLEKVRAQHPRVEVRWEDGRVQVSNWLKLKLELRGVALELCVPPSWELIDSLEYKCAFFSVMHEPLQHDLLQVEEQVPEAEVVFLDGVVVVMMPSGPNSDRASYLQKQFDCFMMRMGIEGIWLFSNSSALYGFTSSNKRYVPDFSVVESVAANRATSEQMQSGKTRVTYKDVKLVVAIELQSATDKVDQVIAKGREMVGNSCTDFYIAFLSYNHGQVWTGSAAGEDLVSQPAFLNLDVVRAGLRLYLSCLPRLTWPYGQQRTYDIGLTAFSVLVDLGCEAIQNGDFDFAQEVVNYLDDVHACSRTGNQMLVTAAAVEATKMVEYLFANNPRIEPHDYSYIVARSSRNDELCAVFEAQGCQLYDSKSITMDAIQQRDTRKAIGLLKSSPTPKSSEEKWCIMDLQEFLTVAVNYVVTDVVEYLLTLGVEPTYENFFQSTHQKRLFDLLTESSGIAEDEKKEIQVLAKRVPSGTRLSHRRKAKPCSAGSGSIGRVDTGAGPSSQDEAQSLDVEIALGDRILSYSVPTDWEPCQCGEQSIAFLVDEVPDNELLEKVRAQHPRVEVRWEDGRVQVSNWLKLKLELRGVALELCVPPSWELIDSLEYKCAFFSVMHEPLQHDLLQVEEQVPEAEVVFLDGVVVVMMPSGPNSDRASYLQKQFDCFMMRMGIEGIWLFSNSSALYGFTSSNKRYVPDFSVVESVAANRATSEQMQSGKTRVTYKDVKLVVAIELQSATDKVDQVIAKGREMVGNSCTDFYIAFLSYNHGQVWTGSAAGEDLVSQPAFLNLDVVRAGLRLYLSCLPRLTWPYGQQRTYDIGLTAFSVLVDLGCEAIQNGDFDFAQEVVNYLDDVHACSRTGNQMLVTAAAVEATKMVEYLFANNPRIEPHDYSYIVARSSRNDELCAVFEAQGCQLYDSKSITMDAIQQRDTRKAIGLLKSSPTPKSSEEKWCIMDLQEFLTVAVNYVVTDVVEYLLTLGVEPTYENFFQSTHQKRLFDLLTESSGIAEDEKKEIQVLAKRVPSGTRLSHRRKAKPCSAGSGSIGRVDTGAGPSSQDEAQSLDVEIALGDRILSYSVPTDWEPCQCGEQSIAFLVDEVPDNELLEKVRAQHPRVEVRWEDGRVQVSNWLKLKLELRGVALELCVPPSWELIDSLEYKCAFFSVMHEPLQHDLLQVEEQVPEAEVVFLDGVVVVMMPSGPNSDRASYLQKQFDCFMMRMGIEGIWLFSNSSALYGFTSSNKRYVPDFSVVESVAANRATSEQMQSGKTRVTYKDVKLVVAIELQSATDKVDQVIAKGREMVGNSCTDFYIAFLSYNHGQVWTGSAAGEDLVSQPAFLNLDVVRAGLRLYLSCLPRLTWPYGQQRTYDIGLTAFSVLVDLGCEAIQNGDFDFAQEVVNYLDDVHARSRTGNQMLVTAAAVEATKMVEYLFANNPRIEPHDYSYIVARSSRNDELCAVFEAQGCQLYDSKSITMDAIQQRDTRKAIGLLKSSPTPKSSEEKWCIMDLQEFLTVAVNYVVTDVVEYLLTLGVEPTYENFFQSTHQKRLFDLLTESSGIAEDEKKEIQVLATRVKGQDCQIHDGKSLTTQAIKSQQSRKAIRLLKSSPTAKSGETWPMSDLEECFTLAIIYGASDVVKYLLTRGVQPSFEDVFHSRNDKELFDLLQRSSGMSEEEREEIEGMAKRMKRRFCGSAR